MIDDYSYNLTDGEWSKDVRSTAKSASAKDTTTRYEIQKRDVERTGIQWSHDHSVETATRRKESSDRKISTLLKKAS